MYCKSSFLGPAWRSIHAGLLPAYQQRCWLVLSADGVHCSRLSWPGDAQTVGCTTVASHIHTAEGTAQRHLEETHTCTRALFKQHLRIIKCPFASFMLIFTLAGPAHLSTR